MGLKNIISDTQNLHHCGFKLKLITESSAVRPPLAFLLISLFLRNLCSLRFEIQPTPNHKTQTKIFSGISGPRTFFRGIVFFLFAGFLQSFWFLVPKAFTAKSKKPRGKPRKKNLRIIGNVWAKNFVQFFLFFLLVFLFSSAFLVFGSGSFYQLLALSKTKKHRGKPTKTKEPLKTKTKKILRNVWAKDFVQRHCFFW